MAWLLEILVLKQNKTKQFRTGEKAQLLNVLVAESEELFNP